MKKLTVGFIGIGQVCDLGYPNDVDSFFILANQHCQSADKILICDLLYKRAIRMEQMEAVANAMERLRIAFTVIYSNQVDWVSLGVDTGDTGLAHGDTLADVYCKFFSLFADTVNYSLLFYSKRGLYLPIRIGFTDIGWFVKEERRQIEEYDSLQGSPFWLR